MSIHFSKERWKRVVENSHAWWTGQLERPLIQVVAQGPDPGRPEPDLPNHSFTAFYDFVGIR